MARLDGTTAMATGASSGIGEAVARALAAEGAHVALCARRRDKLEDLARQIRSDGGSASVHEVDVADAESVRRAVETLTTERGSVDVLVNNAGIGTMAPAAEADLADWHTMVEVNVNGVLNASHTALPHLVRAATGPRGIADVVTVSSVAGRKVSSPAFNVYAATKHAVGAFSEALRQELAGDHVRVGLVEPGLVRSEQTEAMGTAAEAESRMELGLMEAEDIADAVVYMVTRPPRMAVNEMLVRPTEQTR
ncbi:oxidoreductase [Marmoricola endophyticus]|uniref:Oxidoreductase n=1 Tax=Marmoricola endophyticus TaxID=2040280 RepID=A0A917BB86_9ACTN|nr:SDR family oxidoreductase [Marmoricola endophyticus]GGF34546.1 oxidoreductase [Marmoricola endophyticus]